MMTQNEFAMLMDRLEAIEANQRQHLHLHSDERVVERLAALEAERGRYITWKHLVTGMGASAGAGAGLVTLLQRALGG